MDPTLISQPPGFEQQFQQFMFYAGPILQILFWIAVGYSAVWAASTFKRLVDFTTGAEKADKPAKAEKADKDEAVAVEEFVE